MRKETISKKRTIVIHEIMKRPEYKQGITLTTLYEELQVHPRFDEIFNLANPEQFKHSTRALLQHGAPGMKHHNKRDNDFFFLGNSIYTYWGNPDNVVKQILESPYNDEVQKFLNLLKDHNNKVERQALVKVRASQGKFREILLKEFNSCPIRGVVEPGLLIASHIVDYSDCTDAVEKANPYNGLLLSPDVDKLFDSKLISFDPDSGELIISKDLKMDEFNKFHILQNIKLDEKYLNVHRREFLRARNEKYKIA